MPQRFTDMACKLMKGTGSRKFLHRLILVVLIGWPFSALAEQITQSDSITKQLDEKAQEIKYLEGEISITQQRHQSSVEKLVALQREIKDKHTQLAFLQEQYSAQASIENEQMLRNEEQRIRLAELTLNSRVASITRLETKEAELKQQLEALRAEAAQLKDEAAEAQLAQKVEQKTQVIKSDLEVQKDTLARRLLTLQRENERLRKVALDEGKKRELAESRAQLAEQRLKAAKQLLAALQSNQPETATQVNTSLQAKDVASAEMDRVRHLILEDSMNVSDVGLVLFLKTREGANVGQFKHLGAQQYRFDGVIPSKETTYRIGGRIYQVLVGDAEVGQEHVFLFDLSDANQPRLVTFNKALMVGESGAIAAQ